MSRNQRLAMLALAAAVVIVALVVLPGGDDEPDTQPAAQTTPADQTGTTDEPASSTTQTTPTASEPVPRPPLLQAGSESELEFEKGDTITFRVRHRADDEIHVHGYDKSKAVKAGRTTTMSFEASLEGIFEVELEQSGTPLGTIKVEPK